MTTTTHTASGIGVQRRIRALMRIGWPEHELAERIGRTDGRIPWVFAHSPTVPTAEADRTVELIDQLGMSPGPCADTVEFAIRRGWRSWLAWYDIDIDDPSARADTGEDTPDREDAPDPVAVHEAAAGRPPEGIRCVDRREAVRLLSLRRESPRRIGELVGVTERHVTRLRRTLEIPEMRRASAGAGGRVLAAA